MNVCCTLSWRVTCHSAPRPDRGPLRCRRQELQAAEGPEALELAVDALAWAGPSALLVASRVYAQAADGAQDEQARRRPVHAAMPLLRLASRAWQDAERASYQKESLFHIIFLTGRAAQDASPLAVLEWAAWERGRPPAGLQIAEFFATRTVPEAAPPGAGPCLTLARVPAWGALVAAHRKANDEHVKLYGARPRQGRGCGVPWSLCGPRHATAARRAGACASAQRARAEAGAARAQRRARGRRAAWTWRRSGRPSASRTRPATPITTCSAWRLT